MSDKTYKNLLDDGYTTYHEDGSKSKTYKNLLDDGYTTYHEDGSKSQTYQNLLDDGYTTYHYGKQATNNGSTNNGKSHYSIDGISYSTAYITFDDSIDLSVIITSIIGAAVIIWLNYLYAGSVAIIPSIIWSVILSISLIAFRNKRGKPFIWAWLYYMSATAMFMHVMSNRSFETSSSSPLSYLLYVAPIGIAFVIGLIGNLSDFEDRVSSAFLSYLFMAFSWLSYSNKNPEVYHKILKYETIVFIVYALVTLLLAFHEAKKQEKY